MLDAGQLGEIKVGKRKLRISHVTDGSEERLRHFLESVVTEANSAHPSPSPAPEETESGPDAGMTRRFRSFADPVPEDSPPQR